MFPLHPLDRMRAKYTAKWILYLKFKKSPHHNFGHINLIIVYGQRDGVLKGDLRSLYLCLLGQLLTCKADFNPLIFIWTPFLHVIPAAVDEPQDRHSVPDL